MKSRRNLSLTPMAAQILDRVGNQSHYISHIIETRDSEWRRALAALRADGWTRDKLRKWISGAACYDCNALTLIDLYTIAQECHASNQACLDAVEAM